MEFRYTFIFYLFLGLFFVGCGNQSTDNELLTPSSNTSLMPPTSGVETYDKDGPVYREVDAYMDFIHKAAPDVDWRKIEKKNALKNYEAKKQAKQEALLKNSSVETLANGQLVGTWTERGARNQAGSILALDYYAPTDEIYAISDGGSLYRGNLNGTNWTPLNDDMVFKGHAIQVVENAIGGKNIVAAIGKELWYSSDEGLTWTASTGLDFYDDYGTTRKLVETLNGDLYYLVQTWNANPAGEAYELYRSTDKGASFSLVKLFTNASFRRVDMWLPLESDTLFVLNRGQELYKVFDDSIALLNTNTNVPANRLSYLTGYEDANNNRTFYAFIDRQTVYRSTDNGATFVQTGTTTDEAWDVGLFANPFVANHLYYGNIEFYKTTNGGSFWTKQSSWFDYYQYSNDFLHADIMRIAAFKKTNGTPFLLIANHAGIHVSYNNMGNTQNITDFDLNVTQYYTSKTAPTLTPLILGGTQDKGMIRGTDSDSSAILPFDYVVNGDNVQVEMGNYGQSYWTEYPDGLMYYVPDLEGANTMQYQVPGSTKQLWNVPTAPTPNPAEAGILIGGGNLSGGSGSYLIKLLGISPNDPTSTVAQFSYDFRANSNSGTGLISAIATSPTNGSQVYVATGDGTFFYSTDGAASWNKASNFSGPPNDYLYGAFITPSEQNPEVVYFGGSGYSNPAVYRSLNGGQTFSPITNGLPNTLVYNMDFNDDESILFAATEAGPYAYVVAENQWYNILGTDAPLQSYHDVEFVPQSQTARFSTFGRGIWDFRLAPSSYDNNCAFTLETSSKEDTVCLGDFTTLHAMTNGVAPSNVSYIWSNDLGEGDSVEVLLQQSSTFAVTAIDLTTDCAVTENITVHVSDIGNCQPYCDASGSSGTTEDYINGVYLHTIQNSSNKSSYSDFTDISTTLTQGNNYLLGVRLNTAFPLDKAYAWIDFNQDKNFDNSERITMSSYENNHSFGDVVVPANALLGETTMRVRSIYSNGFIYNPCNEYFGEVEDYTVEIVPVTNRGLKAKAFLQGAWEGSTTTGLMRDDLRSQVFIPFTEPYTNLTNFNHYGDGGNESVTIPMFNRTGDDAIVDWMLLELRDANNPATIVATQSVLLQRDGNLVDVYGNNTLQFPNLSATNYYVSIRHRNHLGIMTAQAINLTNSPLVDFTSMGTALYGTNAVKGLGSGYQGLWAGNTSANEQVIFQGSGNDPNEVFFNVLTATGNATNSTNFIYNGYYGSDTNLDGTVIYQGNNNDPNLIFFNVLGHPSNTTFVSNYIISEQLP